MSRKRPPKSVDVTLRDGGYLNDWNFSIKLLTWFATRIDRVGVDIVEVGYLSNNQSLHLAARCPPQLLRELHRKIRHAKVAAMLRPMEHSIGSILESRRDFLDVIRIPTDLLKLSASMEAARMVKAAGLWSCINLTSITAYSPTQIVRAVRRLASSNIVDCIYLADSRGSLEPQDVGPLIKRVRMEWTGNLGFHAHNNLGHAVENSRIALHAGCNLVDGSINGYGLGGGNANLRDLMRMVIKGRTLTNGEEAALKEISEGLKLPRDSENDYLYRLSGAKNLEQEWVAPLTERYRELTARFIETIPRRRFKDLEEVFVSRKKRTAKQGVCKQR